jgi:hypothetical protein
MKPSLTTALTFALATSCAFELDADGLGDEEYEETNETGGEELVGPRSGGTSPATGFWRLEQPADSERTWFVAPGGERVWVLGVNTVMRNSKREGKARCYGISSYIRRHAPTKAAHVEWARLSDGISGGFKVPLPYHFNAVGSFSDTNDFDGTGGRSYMVRASEAGGAGAPYSVVMTPAPRSDSYSLKNVRGTVIASGITRARLGDPYNPAYHADLDQRFAERVAPHRDDSRLQMWFLGNEDGMFDRGAKRTPGVRDFRRWIWSDCPAGAGIDNPSCARYAAAAFLRDRYAGDIAALNARWDSAHVSFADIVEGSGKPVPYKANCNLECREDLQRFVVDGLLREWVVQVTTRLRAADPNHLVATPRLALGSSERFNFYNGGARSDAWVDSGTKVGENRSGIRYSPFTAFRREGDAGFDLIAVNVYEGAASFERPWFTDGVHKMQSESGLPVFVSEFSVRARIDGWSNRGGAGSFVPRGDGISDQLQRGQRYRSQIKQLVGFRHIVGASWHAWSDRFMPTDDSTQINMGLVRCRDDRRDHKAGQRWSRIDREIRGTNRRIYEYVESATGL